MLKRNYYNNRYATMTTTNANTTIATSERVTDVSIGGRLVALLANSSVTVRDREFVVSLQESFKRYSSLSQKQYNYFEVLEKRYDPATLAAANAARQEWTNKWDAWKQKQLEICVRYYSKTPYFSDIVKACEKDTSYIPSEKQFRAMCENKYAKRLVENMTNHKFDVGAVVQQRKSRYIQMEQVGVITAVSDAITRSSANIGGRVYRVMWMHDGNESEVFERDLKTYRNKE